MSNKHTATFDGVTHKRTSVNRIYPYMVVCVENIATSRAALIERNKNLPADRQAESLAWFDERVKNATGRYLSSDGQSFVLDAGWCGRFDLAQKLQVQKAKHYGIANVHIVPTNFRDSVEGDK